MIIRVHDTTSTSRSQMFSPTVHRKWDLVFTWTFMFSALLPIFSGVNSEAEEVRRSLVQFMAKLSPTNDAPRDDSWGWNLTSDPCTWKGVTCNPGSPVIQKIILDGLQLGGVFDPEPLCSARSLLVLSLSGNNLGGGIPHQISDCKHLTHLYLSSNWFTGDIPLSISKLSSLKRIDVSNNTLTGKLPNLGRSPGLLSFLAQNNRFTGVLPEIDFARFEEFNVSNNGLSGEIPDVKGRFGADSFSGNPGLCGKPLSNSCPSLPKQRSKQWSTDRFLINLGYAFLGLVIVLLIVLEFVSLRRRKYRVFDDEKVVTEGENQGTRTPSVEFKDGDKSEYLITSTLVVLDNRVVKDLSLDDLLGAPAELLGRGKHGTLYKVMIGDSVVLAVKRIKDSGILTEEFQWRMKRIDRTKHRNVLPPLAFYCSRQEKLVVYEFQPNGSLFKLLHGEYTNLPNRHWSSHIHTWIIYGIPGYFEGSWDEQIFDWGTRLSSAASIAGALAFMHRELREDGIAHGDLKSTNILFNSNMEPCISEYGLMMVENAQDYTSGLVSGDRFDSFEADIYAFGVVLLELLTGKMVENGGLDVARWVHSVVREEWTSEVFDRALISEGASEERMVNLLQIALKCISPSPGERPSMSEVAMMIDSLREEEERSMISEPSSVFLAPKESGLLENA